MLPDILAILAFVGSCAFAVSAIPAAYEAYKAGTCTYNGEFLACWALGELCYLVYMPMTGQYTLLLNYIPNFICLLIIMYYNNRMTVPPLKPAAPLPLPIKIDTYTIEALDETGKFSGYLNIEAWSHLTERDILYTALGRQFITHSHPDSEFKFFKAAASARIVGCIYG